jgi:prevent-host-death family protein
MTSIGLDEARTRLSELLDQVARGEKILITRRGKPAALLVPPPLEAEWDVREVVREMLEIRDRAGPTLGGTATIRELIEEGRRF